MFIEGNLSFRTKTNFSFCFIWKLLCVRLWILQIGMIEFTEKKKRNTIQTSERFS